MPAGNSHLLISLMSTSAAKLLKAANTLWFLFLQLDDSQEVQAIQFSSLDAQTQET